MTELWTMQDAGRFLVPPTAESNKYSRGVLGFATGSVEFPGAAILGVSAAMHTGVGMIRFIGPDTVTKQVLNHRPEAVTVHGGVNAWVVGSGQPEEREPNEIQREAYGSGVPVVLDAGAIIHASIPHGQAVVTPHIGELTRLLSAHSYEISPSQVMADPSRYARLAAEKFGCTFIVKGNTSYIANEHGRVIQVGPASVWLATAGTGDVLAGVIGAVLATNYRRLADNPAMLIELVATAAVLHADAAAELSQHGPILALKLAEQIALSVARALRV